MSLQCLLWLDLVSAPRSFLVCVTVLCHTSSCYLTPNSCYRNLHPSSSPRVHCCALHLEQKIDFKIGWLLSLPAVHALSAPLGAINNLRRRRSEPDCRDQHVPSILVVLRICR
ncbi:hypothetical protein BDV06DRAFT_188753 [Aspergillus oleicola]